MARSLQLTIHESQQELEQHLSNKKSATGKERLQMLYWLKRGIAKNRKLFGKGKRLRYLCQDESRFGLHTIMGRMLTLKGVKPHGFTQWPRDNFYLYGVVEPLTGDTYFYEFSHLDSCCFQLFINQVSQRFADSVVILQMDQGRFHLTRQLDWPENLIPICQPAHSPEQGDQ